MYRLRHKVDAVQPQIMVELRQAGLQCESVACVGQDFPDIIVAAPVTDKLRDAWAWWNLLVELKSPGGQLEAGQRIWHQWWKGPVMVARSAEDILRAIGRT